MLLAHQPYFAYYGVMEEITVGCCQFHPELGDRKVNIDRMIEYIGEGSKHHIDVLLFPELITTGYLGARSIRELCEPVTGPWVKELAVAAGENRTGIVFGFAEEDNGRCYNSACFVLPSGEIAGVYRKTHLWDTERKWASPGDSFPVFNFPGAAVAGWICYDTRFPEAARKAASAGGEVAFVPTAWLGPAREWYLALQARALDNNIFTAGADIIQPEIGCTGVSLITGPDGDIIAAADEGKEGIISASLQPSRRDERLKRMNLLKDRRLDLYGG
ncbi:MAG: carbon-nitrogen hydrolase family protein [Spirochaetia bacterium]